MKLENLKAIDTPSQKDNLSQEPDPITGRRIDGSQVYIPYNPRTGLSDLATLSECLNRESAGINETIENFNEKLSAMNVGLEVWCPQEGYPKYGFARCGEKWQLALEFKNREEIFAKPLLVGSREERVEGLAHFDQIVELLLHKARETIDQIRLSKRKAGIV